MKWTKFQKSSHMTLMDFAEILSSQCTHQEIKILKILSSYEWFQNYSYLNYGSFKLDIQLLQFMAFWNCSYSAIFNSKKSSNWLLQYLHLLQLSTTSIIFFFFFFTFSVRCNLTRENPEGLQFIAAILCQDMSELSTGQFSALA